VAEPIVWTIQTSLVTDLAAINGVSPYFNTIASVENFKREGNNLKANTLVVGLSELTRAEAETQGKYYWRATFEIAGMVAPSASLPDDQLATRLLTDITRAVMANPGRTVSGTQYAIDTQIMAPQLVTQYDERIGVTCMVEVHFRTSLTDLTSL